MAVIIIQLLVTISVIMLNTALGYIGDLIIILSRVMLYIIMVEVMIMMEFRLNYPHIILFPPTASVIQTALVML